MRTRPLPLTLIALLVAILATTTVSQPASAGLVCGDIADLVVIYFQKHIRFHQLTDELRDRTIENYLRRIDPQRVLFLEADVEEISKSFGGIFNEIQKADCTRLQNLQQQVVWHHREVEGFVRGFVGSDDYEMDPEVELRLDPDERGQPKTREERDDLLRVLSHFGISNYLSTGSELPEAKKRLIHRYELQTRRAVEKTREDIYAEFLDAFARALDPHSGYLSADDVEDFQIQMQLSLEGIGVALTERDGYAVVEQIIPGGAADRLKVLEPKDKIIAVAEDGKEPVDVIDMALRDVVRLIRGRKGTRVQLTVLRQGEETERLQVAIQRDTIDLEQQAAKLSFETVPVDGRELKIALLDLPSFYGDEDPGKRKGSRDVARLLKQARDAEVDGLILDLSRNGGGLLEDAVAISGFFIRKGGIVAVKESGREKSRVMRDPDDGILFSGPMAILVSRWSASASEILAGALKDYRRALIVGDDHTFGKGTVQSVVPLRQGLGALKITTALFFRPGGASTQNSGVRSDVTFPSFLSTDAFGESHKRHSLSAQPIPPFRGDEANGGDGSTHWKPVSGETISVLAGMSKRRILENAYFQKIERELAKQESANGVVRLAEIIREREETNGKGRFHVVAPGDTLWGISDTYLGSPWLWPAIWHGNQTIEDPHRIAPGDRIWIGPDETQEVDADEEVDPSPPMREALAILSDMIALAP
jgi:carboxyl-terminal processing protease